MQIADLEFWKERKVCCMMKVWTVLSLNDWCYTAQGFNSLGLGTFIILES